MHICVLKHRMDLEIDGLDMMTEKNGSDLDSMHDLALEVFNHTMEHVHLLISLVSSMNIHDRLPSG